MLMFCALDTDEFRSQLQRPSLEPMPISVFYVISAPLGTPEYERQLKNYETLDWDAPFKVRTPDSPPRKKARRLAPGAVYHEQFYQAPEEVPSSDEDERDYVDHSIAKLVEAGLVRRNSRVDESGLLGFDRHIAPPKQLQEGVPTWFQNVDKKISYEESHKQLCRYFLALDEPARRAELDQGLRRESIELYNANMRRIVADPVGTRPNAVTTSVGTASGKGTLHKVKESNEMMAQRDRKLSIKRRKILAKIAVQRKVRRRFIQRRLWAMCTDSVKQQVERLNKMLRDWKYETVEPHEHCHSITHVVDTKYGSVEYQELVLSSDLGGDRVDEACLGVQLPASPTDRPEMCQLTSAGELQITGLLGPTYTVTQKAPDQKTFNPVAKAKRNLSKLFRSDNAIPWSSFKYLVNHFPSWQFSRKSEFLEKRRDRIGKMGFTSKQYTDSNELDSQLVTVEATKAGVENLLRPALCRTIVRELNGCGFMPRSAMLGLLGDTNTFWARRDEK